ncbi:PQQ-dependent sugar dehydrogenase [Halobacteriaceae archaeon GCM10025711]
MTRREFLALTGVALGGGMVGPASAQEFSLATGPSVGVETVATGFTAPLGFEMAPGDDRYFVVDQPGTVHAVDPESGETTPFLDVEGRVLVSSGYDERGLLGLAFHPEFAENGRFYVRYSAPPRDGTPDGYDHTFVLSEFQASEDRTTGVPDSERTVLEIPEPQFNHNAGAIAFGPDGYLYVGVGDGGGSNDDSRGHVDDWYDANAGGNGQDVTENLLGSVLRIDVDGREDGKSYGIPDDNPLVGRPGLDEHWAWGFRNPWRFSFDGDRLFVADVGQNLYEEVSIVERGGNYGWNVREGDRCFSTDSPSSPPASCPDAAPDGPLRDPIVAYPHQANGETVGVAVIGGYRYRGDAIPALQGTYVFADWRADGRLFAATPPADGRLFAATPPADGDGPWSMAAVPMADPGDAFGQFVLGLGRDRDGELYALTSQQSGVEGETGALHRVVPVEGRRPPRPTAMRSRAPGSPGSGPSPPSVASRSRPPSPHGSGVAMADRWGSRQVGNAKTDVGWFHISPPR